MKRNLNLIATAASLLLLGLSGESHAFQSYQDSLVGSGLLSNKSVEAQARPLIVKSERKLLSELKPLTMPKPKQLSSSRRPKSGTTAQTDNASTAVSPSVARLPDAGMPAGYERGPGVPPIIKSTARRLNQGDGVGVIPPVVQSNSSGVNRQVQTPIKPAADASARTVAYVPQGSSSRVPAGSATRSLLPQVESSAAPLPFEGGAQSFSGSGTRSVLPFEGGAQSFSGSGTRSVLDQPPVNSGTPEYFSAGPAIGEQPVFDDGGSATCAPLVANEGACATCGTGMTDGVCPTCGPGAGYSNGPVIEDFGTFGLISASRCYLHAEALLFTRADGDIAAPTVGALNDFDSGGGLRLLFGRKTDSINGRELGFFALSGIEEDLTITNSPFLVEDIQTQSKESELWSIEFNRVNFGWDVVKSFAGLKFIRFDDSYQFQAIDPIPGNNSSSSLDSVNNLFGAHIGGELFYDIGYRWSGSVKGSWGVYANFNDFDSTVAAATGSPLTTESNQGTISTAVDLSFLAHYQIRTDMRFQIGYNLIFVGNVASVADNLVQQVPTLNSIDVSDSDDVFFHGLSLGLEFYR